MSTVSAPTEKRVIPDRLGTPFRRIMSSWEVLLFGVAVLIFIFNSLASPYFLNAWNLSDATFNFTEKAMIAFAMALLVIAGEIDLSVAAIIALASTAMGAAAQVGVGTPGLVLIGIGTGLLCGIFNGFLVSVLKLPSIVVTIGTMSLFRGISYIVLGDQAYGKYPADFAYFGQGYVVWVFSFEFVLFIVAGSRLCDPAARHEFRPPDLYDRQQRFCRPLLRHPRGTHKVHPLHADRRDERHCRGLPHLASRLHPPVDRAGLGARGRHHGRARRRLDPRRLGNDRRCRHRRLRHGPRHLRPRPAQRSGHRHVDLHRPAAHHHHRHPDHRPPHQSHELQMTLEKHAFKMKLNPGMEAEYRKRHDEIWPELVDLLHKSGASDYSIHLDRGDEYAVRRV